MKRYEIEQLKKYLDTLEDGKPSAQQETTVTIKPPEFDNGYSEKEIHPSYHSDR